MIETSAPAIAGGMGEGVGYPGYTSREDRSSVTTKDAFTSEEWTLVLESPTGAGMAVITASPGGTFRETFAMSKAYAEAHAEHGRTELLDEIVASRPKVDRSRYHSNEELREHALDHLREAVAVLKAKATSEEVDDYRRFVLGVVQRVAAAHREQGQDVSPQEAAAIAAIGSALGDPPA